MAKIMGGKPNGQTRWMVVFLIIVEAVIEIVKAIF